MTTQRRTELRGLARMLVDYFPGGCAPVIRALVRTGELTYYESKIVAFDVIVLRLRALLR